MTQAYLLAAGEGKRAGGPKAWAIHKNQPLLKHQVDFMLRRFEPADLAIAIQPGWLAKSEKLCRHAHWVEVDPQGSPLASLQALLKVRPAAFPFFVWHVDHPVWDAKLFEKLETSLGENEGARPVFEGRRGHPVLLARELGLRILALNPASERLDEFLRTRKIADAPVGSAICLENWNEEVPA